MKKEKDKMFIVRKFIKANSVLDAIKKEKKVAPHEVYIDGDWKKELPSAIGFHAGSEPAEEDEDE